MSIACPPGEHSPSSPLPRIALSSKQYHGYSLWIELVMQRAEHSVVILGIGIEISIVRRVQEFRRCIR